MSWSDVIGFAVMGFTITGVFIIQRVQVREHILMYKRQVDLKERILEMQNQVIQEHNRMSELWASWAKFRDEVTK